MLYQTASPVSKGGEAGREQQPKAHPSSTGEQGHWELATEHALVALKMLCTGLADTGAEPHTGKELTGCLPDRMELRCL